MANYATQTWTNGSGGGTPLSAARLTVIENGITNAVGKTPTAGSPQTVTSADAGDQALILKAAAAATAAIQEWRNSGGTVLASVTAAGVGSFTGVTLADASNVVLNTTTGSKIGTGATQKLGFWNATPVVQQAAVADATDAASVITQLNDLLAKLRTIGIIAT